MPASWLSQYAFWNGRSVASCCVTSYCRGVSSFFRLSSDGFLNVFMAWLPDWAILDDPGDDPSVVWAARPPAVIMLAAAIAIVPAMRTNRFRSSMSGPSESAVERVSFPTHQNRALRRLVPPSISYADR